MLYSLPFLKFSICYISLFYINSYYLIPDFFIPKKYVRYFLCVIILLAGVFYLRPFDELMNSRDRQSHASSVQMHPRPPFDGGDRGFGMQPPPSGPSGQHFDQGPPPSMGNSRGPRHFDMNSLLIFVLIMAFSMSLQSIKQWQITEKRAILAEADKAIAELSFLKAQINPHFLYNTLNNIYTLSIIGSEKTSDSIMKLSNIMRYVTDEAEANFVPLTSELACISNFIDLQKLRLGKMVTLNYSVDGEAENHQISPLLLMTFIENVFKYGLSNHVPALITIAIRMENGKILFHCQNTIFEHKRDVERTGIGIENTRKRLQHLYPDKHSLNINQDDGVFTVDLVLHS